MNARPKKKLCWNCEGNVSIKEDNCPYCGVSLIPSSIPGVGGHGEAPIAPPYRINSQTSDIPASPYASNAADEEVKEEAAEEEESETSVPSDKTAMTVVLMIAGSAFFLFGLILYFFSSKSVMTLSWNASYWYIYALAGLGMLGAGWYFLNKELPQGS